MSAAARGRVGSREATMSEPQASATILPAEKVKTFPTTPGLYLMKDAQGRVIYVGKAKNLRARASSYFHKTAAQDRRICDWIDEVADIDHLAADSEVDALLLEARLIKDIQPKYNHDLKDDKSFPYLQISTAEDFPRVNFTREPKDTGVKLYGPFPRAKSLRGAIQVLQRIFKFRTCSLEIDADDQRWRWFRPCLLASINQCTAPCNLRIDRKPTAATSSACASSSKARRTWCSRRWKPRCSKPARLFCTRRPRGCETRSRRCKT
jgi:excinuclease ABC subunit C